MGRTEPCWAVLAAVALAMVAGCSRPYQHKRLAANSLEHARIAQLLSAVRQAGPVGLEALLAQDGAPGMDEPHRRRLAAALAPLAQAQHVELVGVDRFGSDICRATFQISRGNEVAAVCLLLRGRGADLHWLQPN